MTAIDEAFEDVEMISTPQVATLLGITQARAREFADANGVGRVGNSFGWTEDDVQALADLLAEQDEEDELAEDEEADGDDDEDEGDDDDDDE